MSSRRRSVTATTPPSDWLAPHRWRFLSSLADQGYTRGTLRTYGDAASVFCRAPKASTQSERCMRHEVGATLHADRGGTTGMPPGASSNEPIVASSATGMSV